MHALQYTPDFSQHGRDASTLQNWMDDLRAQTTPARPMKTKKTQPQTGQKTWAGLTVAVTIVVILLLLLVRIAVD